MLYLANLYCPCHTECVRLFDTKNRMPCIGLCGHTVCLECVQRKLHLSCPICNLPDSFVNQTPNFASIEIIEECRQNFGKLMKNWWKGETLHEGPCSKCSDQSPSLRICLTCDLYDLCRISDRQLRLIMRSDVDLLKLTRHVLCSDCAIDHHNGHQIIKIFDIKHSKQDIRMKTASIILNLFRAKMEEMHMMFHCILRHMRIEKIGRNLILMLTIIYNKYHDEGECGYFGKLIKMELIGKYIEDIDKKKDDLFGEGKEDCECQTLYNKALSKYRRDTDVDYIYDRMTHDCIEKLTTGCPLFFQSNLKYRLELYSAIGVVPVEKVTPEPFNNRGCPLCVMFDHSEHSNKPVNFYRENWMKIIDTFWRSELPPLANYCLRCLHHLNLFDVGVSCRKWKKKVQNTENYRFLNQFTGEERNRKYLRLRLQHPNYTCDHHNCLMKNSSFWKYDIILKVLRHWGRIVDDGIEHAEGIVDCQLRRVRLKSSDSQLIRDICAIDLRRDQPDDFSLKIAKVEESFAVLKSRWERFQKGAGEDPKHGTICKCTPIWRKNREAMEFLRKKNKDQWRGFVEFKSSMENMAEYRLEEELNGCPMKYNHNIVLDSLTLEQLKATDLDDFVESFQRVLQLNPVG